MDHSTSLYVRSFAATAAQQNTHARRDVAGHSGGKIISPLQYTIVIFRFSSSRSFSVVVDRGGAVARRSRPGSREVCIIIHAPNHQGNKTNDRYQSFMRCGHEQDLKQGLEKKRGNIIMNGTTTMNYARHTRSI